MKEVASQPRGDDFPWVTIETFDSARLSSWDSEVSAVPGASFFHASPWMRVLEASYEFRPVGLMFRRGGRVAGLIPLVEVLSRFTGRRGVSLPFADECPPLLTNEGRELNLLVPLAAFARSQRWDFFEVRGSNSSLQPAVPSVSFHGHSVALSEDDRRVWDELKAPVRTAVRKAQSSGVSVEWTGELAGLREFHRLYCLTRQRHGLPPQPFSFFEAIHRHIIDAHAGQVVLARSGGRCVAGAVFFRFGRRVIFKYGAFDPRFQKCRANNLIMWEALKHYGHEGCTSMDLGRTSLGNEGLRRFKSGWATSESSINYAKYDLHAGGFVKEKDMAAGWYNWAFRLAPRWVSGIAGRILYKHWA